MFKIICIQKKELSPHTDDIIQWRHSTDEVTTRRDANGEDCFAVAQ